MGGLIARVPQVAPAHGPAPARAPESWPGLLDAAQQWLLQEHPGLARTARDGGDGRRRLQQALAGWLVRRGAVPSAAGSEALAERIAAELVGLGPLDPLLADPDVSEVMVNGPDEVYVERRGRLERTDVRFESEEHVVQVVQRVIAPLGRRLDYAQPFVDARLSDGSRLHAIIPPLAVRGPAVTIRRFARRRIGPGELVAGGAACAELMEYLRRCVEARANVVVSGRTSTGKTTLLNVLAGFVDPGERIVTIEDAAELQLGHPHVVSLEARMPGPDGSGRVTVRDLLRNALRMRPDRLVIGEVRGAEAFDLLHAMNTGHDGSMSTVHANGPDDALDRLENMVLLAGEVLPHAVLRAQVASVIDVVVHTVRDAEGRRRIASVCTVTVRGGRRQVTPAFTLLADGRWRDHGTPVPSRRHAA